MKRLSDFEKTYLEKIQDKTIKEIMGEFRSLYDVPPFESESCLMELKDLGFKFETDFFRFVLKDKEFLSLPIIATVYDGDEETYSFAIEEDSKGYHKTIRFSDCSC